MGPQVGAELTEKGAEALSPGDPDAYVLPDLISLSHCTINLLPLWKKKAVYRL